LPFVAIRNDVSRPHRVCSAVCGSSPSVSLISGVGDASLQSIETDVLAKEADVTALAVLSTQRIDG
jgi:hypothetical protein